MEDYDGPEKSANRETVSTVRGGTLTRAQSRCSEKMR